MWLYSVGNAYGGKLVYINCGESGGLKDGVTRE